MSLPFFYQEHLDTSSPQLVLDEDTSKHVVQVLRMRIGESLQLTNGQGLLLTAQIAQDHKKHCVVEVAGIASLPAGKRQISIAISPVKNNSRFEWFLEKATEMGVTSIIPLLCERTEKQHFRHDRMKNILVSAMLQSQQVWLPLLHTPIKFQELVSTTAQHQKFIAHCLDGEKIQLQDMVNADLTSQLILIGPEGDFTPAEIELAMVHHFMPVSLGNTRLRTETAGMVAAALLINT